eukprot:8246542-Alexandrium_andersonii.AAC.1
MGKAHCLRTSRQHGHSARSYAIPRGLTLVAMFVASTCQHPSIPSSCRPPSLNLLSVPHVPAACR